MKMTVGDRGQVTIPKEIRVAFSITADTEVRFVIDNGQIVLQPVQKPLNLDKWKGQAASVLRELNYDNPDQLVADLRGRDEE